MNPTEISTLASTVEVVGKFISTIGFPIAVALYLLIVLPKHVDRMVSSNEKMITAIGNMRGDIQRFTVLVEYLEGRFRDRRQDP